MREQTAKELRRQAKASDGVTLERGYDEVVTLKKVKNAEGKMVLVKAVTLVNKPASVRAVYRGLKKAKRHE